MNSSIYNNKNLNQSNNPTRESMVAFSILLLCLFCLIVGLFTLREKSKLASEDGSQLVSSLLGDKVAVIGLEGVIYESFYSKKPFSSNLTAPAVKHELEKAIEDKQVKAVLLRVNSPGGTVGASQELYKLIKDLRDKEKPVLVSVGDVCASGCYYLASAADAIIANPGSLTGSIGVISQGLNYVGLFEKLGLRDQTFKAGKFKDLGSGSRFVSEEERKILQSLLDDSYDQFLTDIETGRDMDREELEKIAEGLVYTGRQAYDVKLIDQLGTYDDAKDMMRSLLEKYGYKKAATINFEETWSKKKISTLEEFLDLGLTDSMMGNVLGIFNRILFGSQQAANAELSHPVSFSRYQPMWMMPQ